MIRFASALSLAALLAAAPAVAQEAARDFQLPPAPTPTQDTRVQGPVDTEGAVPVRPRVIETARPATPSPAPSASAAPTIVLPAPAATSAAQPARSATSIPATRSAPSGPPAISTPLAPAGQASPQATASDPLPLPTSPALPVGSQMAEPSPAPAETSSQLWLWLLLAMAAIAGIAFVLLRRRRSSAEPPTIVAPIVTPFTPPTPLDHHALTVAVEAVRMDRSVLNATVGYRVTLRNRTAKALSGLAIEADLVSASKDRSTEAQLASPTQALTPRHTIDRLSPGQSVRLEGQVRLPLAEASAIWQGRVGLLIPLLKVRATAAEATPVATTLVIGRREGGGARPQPFRLDEPPRSYAPLAQRVLDAAPVAA